MNIYDIAKEAGVSISTVSRVLNKKSNVREDTKQRVEAVLEKHSYRPSAIARGLVSSSMRTVAVLTVDIRVPPCVQWQCSLWISGYLTMQGQHIQSSGSSAAEDMR